MKNKVQMKKIRVSKALKIFLFFSNIFRNSKSYENSEESF
jgi:hypothetical protein